MNPVLFAILQNNKADIKAIVDKIGIEAIIELAPHLIAIAETASKAAPRAG